MVSVTSSRLGAVSTVISQSITLHGLRNYNTDSIYERCGTMQTKISKRIQRVSQA